MTCKMHTYEMIEILKAHQEGDLIERQCPDTFKWIPCPSPSFDFSKYYYRVAEPANKLYLIVWDDGSASGYPTRRDLYSECADAFETDDYDYLLEVEVE